MSGRARHRLNLCYAYTRTGVLSKKEVYMSVESSIVKSAESITENNAVPVVAFFGNMIGAISEFQFWNILQLDLQRKNLAVNNANLYLNYQNNLLFKQNLKLLENANFQLNTISNQIVELKNLLIEQASNEQRENQAKELIFNINKMLSNLAKSSDDVYIALEAKMLLKLIESNNITTASFTQISDKEYFDEILGKLKNNTKEISKESDEEIDSFVLVYNYLAELITSESSLNNIQVINFPENYNFSKPVEIPKILDLEEELKTEINSGYKDLSLFSVKLKNFMSDGTDLKTVFEQFYKEKKEYQIYLIRHKYDSIISAQLKSSLQYTECVEKIKFCQKAINEFLEKHTEIQNDFPKIDFKKKVPKIFDCNSLFSDCNYEMKKEEEQLDTYYKDAIEKINQKASIPDPQKNKKKKWGFFWKKK